MITVKHDRPFVIAGPCMAESEDLLFAVAEPLRALAAELKFDLVFKSSFDKANRTAIDSYRGPGLDRAMQWFDSIKKKLGVPVLTDIHETAQASAVAAVVDVIQIPAFLCRQTDLVVAAAETGRMVNIKKGQFMSPGSMEHIVVKARSAAQARGLTPNVTLTERGTTFGYGNLVVDMRGFEIMSHSAVPLIFDITHSTQIPPTGGEGGKTSGGERRMAPVLARAATATGYLSGYFLEVHTNPAQAKSDKGAQLTVTQAEALLRQLVPFWHQARQFSAIDTIFQKDII